MLEPVLYTAMARRRNSLTTWDSTKTNSNILLTNDLKTARNPATVADRITKATWGIAAGSKAYFELNMDVIDNTTPGSAGVGLANASQSSADGAFLGESGSNSLGWFADGTAFLNNATVGTWATFAQGNRLRLAVDRMNNKIWGAVGTGNWNNSGTDNPETNSGGVSISAITGTLFVALSQHDGNDVTSIVASRRSLLYALPRGFSILT